MGKAFRILAWAFTAVMVLTVIFVKAPKAAGGKSGGDQASKIIETSGSSLSKVINSLMGGDSA